jgi:DNA-binding transcriptional MerR regulator
MLDDPDLVLTPPSSQHTNLGTMRIGEVSDLSGVSVRMLRHNDRAGLLSPSHRASTDYRDYSPAELGRLFRIEALRSLGLTLAEVGDALDDPTMDAATVLDRLRQENRDRIRTEQDLLPHLTEVSDTGPETWEDALRVTAMLTALREGSSRQRQAAVLQATASQSPDQQPVAALVASYLEEPDENAAGALRWPVWGRTPYPHSSTVPTDRRWRGVVSSRSSA